MSRMRPGVGRGSNKNFEKPKNLTFAIKKLVNELLHFKYYLLFAGICAIIACLLTVKSPDFLSELVNYISAGLVINQSNLELLGNDIKENFKSQIVQDNIKNAFEMNLSSQNISSILNNPNITKEQKEEFTSILESINKDENEDKIQIINKIMQLPDEILSSIFVPYEIDGKAITNEQRQELVKIISKIDMQNIEDNQNSTLMSNVNSMALDFTIPQNLSQILFIDITIDDVQITKQDQADFINKISSVTNEQNSTKILEVLSQMPESVQKIIEPKIDFESIKKVVAILIILYLISALANYIGQILMVTVSNNFAKSLRKKVVEKINKLPLPFFDKHQTGDTLSIVTNDVDIIGQNLNNSLSTLVTSIIMVVGACFMMFTTNIVLAFTAIFSSLIGIVISGLLVSKSQKYFVLRQQELGELNSHIEEIYTNIAIVKSYNGRDKAKQEFNILNEKVKNANEKSQFLSGIMQPLMSFIGNFGYVCVCIVGALLALNNVITFGVIIAFITYVRLFTQPLSQMAQSITSLQSVGAAAERVFEFLDNPNMKQTNVTDTIKRDEVKGKVDFENVVFTYDGNEKPTIKNFSASAKPKQKIAIVGPTGAGKTTLVNLLMKFYDIDSGDIKIDDISIKNMSRQNVHDLFTMVLQDTWIYDGTVMDNIKYNIENVTEKQVKQVCKEIGLDHFINTLPQGYNTVLNENDSVSAGQRQLLTIARGMIENAPILILDEATSNVDTRTEELVQKAMDKLSEGKTSFIIAHRLSTIKNADLILVVNDGNIVEQGTHDELLKLNGFYAKLYNSQFEKNQIDEIE